MQTRRTLLAALAACASTASAYAAERSPDDLVAAADAFRLNKSEDQGAKVILRMTDGQGAAKSVTRLSVLSRGTSAVVKMEDGEMRGMKFLGTPQGNWMYAPNTRRAMRITAVQMLRGNTNVGDLSRLSFADDYTAAFAEPRTATVDGKDCWVLSLKAKSPASTYAAMTLNLDKATGAPVRADVFLASGKRIKTILFAAPTTIGGRRLVATVTYVDGVNPDKKTVLETLSVDGAKVNAGMFKPEALATEF